MGRAVLHSIETGKISVDRRGQAAFAPARQPVPVMRERQSLRRIGNQAVLRRGRAAAPEPAQVPPIVHDVLASPGQALDPVARADLEARFGQGFDDVRVHADTRAEESAAAVGARAWAVGTDIAFGRGQYDPMSSQGRGLLAHELAHVVQQRNLPRASDGLRLGEPDDVYEREAEAAAASVVAEGKPRPPAALAEQRLQRSFLSGLLDVLLFVPRLFGLSVFPAEDLKEYLAALKTRKGPENHIFSDNKARACVSRESEFGPYDTDTKTWLIQEMLGGYTSFLDEGAIIMLLRRSVPEIPKIVGAIGRDKIWAKFGGGNRRVIEALTMTAADAGDALVGRLRSLDPDEIQDYAANAVDPAIKECARRAAALAKITTQVSVGATISPAGEAGLTINGVKILVRPDGIDPSLGEHAMTYGNFQFANYSPIAVTPDIANQPVAFDPVDITLTIWTDFPSSEAKDKPSGYGAGPTLRAHERAHGNAWLEFIRQNRPPAFPGTSPMLPAQFNAAIEQYKSLTADYAKRAGDFALRAGDCVGQRPTDDQLRGTGYTAAAIAAICHQP